MKYTDVPVQKIDPSKPDTIPKFIDKLQIPEVAKPVDWIGKAAYYEIHMIQAYHKFHSLFPFARVWGYEGRYPGPTIETMKDKTIYVKWINNLPYKHLLPIDHTLHGAIDTPDVRTVVHVHGANIEPHSDGYPEAWYTQNYSITGPSFTRKIYEYTNHQQSTTLWYHDHSMGITRLNVYAGLAGFYLIRDPQEKRLHLPGGIYEIPMMIQDKSFNADGSLFYPDTPPFSVPVKPSIVPGFLGNTIVVNGKVWPYLNVEPRKYRFRILNASNRREYNLSLSNNSEFYQIGTDGGLLHHTAKISSFILYPAERIDIVIDFSKFKGEEITLLNANTDPNLSVIMKFKVVLPLKSKDTSEVPEELYPFTHIDEEMATNVRDLPLNVSTDHYGRPMLLLNNRMWSDPATEKPELDSIEIWNLINPVANLSHPIHVHLVQFKILDRRPFDIQKYQTDGKIEYTGPAEAPLPFEQGWKDVVRAEGGKVTRIIMHFKDHSGDFVWHCHFLEHEDHDMMRPLKVIKDSFSIN
ncbi:multicopper oxidase [uncultured Clostridium sp.]|uniref:multicopper oxidase family protein n=1 Tax=uncultured Clostridium sp. TaxID=59620 RepID=UPI0028E6634B|nr:multicopper oxidase [uncultured Clostridium sp.]